MGVEQTPQTSERSCIYGRPYASIALHTGGVSGEPFKGPAHRELTLGRRDKIRVVFLFQQGVRKN